MLFNTFLFAVVFLPLTLLGYFAISKYSMRLSIGFLLLASLVFYSYWDISFLPLLLGSITMNYLVGRLIFWKREIGRNYLAKIALILGLVLNLGLLGFFKYFDFVVANLAWTTGLDLKPPGITLPIGISFFTFTQIAYLVDSYAGKVREQKVENYGLFVTYFPHMIAGPILHHKDMMPQFDQSASHVFSSGRLLVGMSIFVVGLFKKVVLADGVARFVGPVFDVHFADLTMLEAWCGALAYTFQLYFDFSAYSDMAYGLSYIFGIILPINFYSPYKARSIIDFWRRWHITLSTFLKDYLYIALGGNRFGSTRRYINLLVTMLLGGLWHGANWTFVVWGALHGAYLVINHVFRHFMGARKSALVDALGWPITFLVVVVAWVFFRATSLGVAFDVLQAMLGGTFHQVAGEGLLGFNRIMQIYECLAWLIVCGLIAFFVPNAYELIQRQEVRRLEAGQGDRAIEGGWLGFLMALAFILLAISETRGTSEFIYFNF